MQRFTELKVWKRSHGLVLDVYKLMKGFPSDERFNLAAQLRRAVLSVPTNIAEGSKRRSSQEYARFLIYAEGFTLQKRNTCWLSLGISDIWRPRIAIPL